MGQQWTAAEAGTLGAADLGMTKALLEEVAINPTIETQELTQDWEIDSRRAQQNFVHQDPEERSSVPTREGARVAYECSGVSNRGVGRR